MRHSLIRWITQILLLVVAITIGVNVSADGASTLRRYPAMGAVEPFVPVGNSGGGDVTVQFAPSGCDSGNFCSYNQGNGGALCFQSSTSTAYWPVACADQNDSAFDNSSRAIDLYWGWDYSDAYFQLCANCYLLYMTQNYFNACPGGGTSCSGYGQEMYDNVESSKFI